MADEAGDLERRAVAAYLAGHDDESGELWASAYAARQADGDWAGAGRCSAWLVWNLTFRGEMARASGWRARGEEVVVARATDFAERGLLLILDALFQLDDDPSAAFEGFVAAGEHGERFGNADVVTLSLLGRGQALIAQGEIAKGMALLDAAMVAVTAGEVTAPIAGVVYCAVLIECRDTFDIRRAREWSKELMRWCDSRPEMVPFRGQCLVHRSEVLQLEGDWSNASDAARRACEALAGHPAIGDAYYQQAEMHRLCGEHDAADAGYRKASQYGREPHPGLALLRLAQGATSAAVAAMRRVVDETHAPAKRATMLAAGVEIMLAAEDREAADVAANELAQIAEQLDIPLLQARAKEALGAVLLARGDALGALELLRAAWSMWQEAGAPYEAARVRSLIGAACRILGDLDTADLEDDAARVCFETLGAATDIARLGGHAKGALPAGLTAREAEVLVLVASGRSNHEIAVALVVSDHTVRRHLQNIFTKIGVGSRAAATAYAFRHGLA
jgi:DNA-binding CsgD family transcriptional regulator/tetratricopeptide (TPR) repeat protein